MAPSMARPVVPPAAPVAPRAAVPSPMDFGRSAEGLKDIEEVVIHRVMQRVDVVLDQRLREAIATVVLEQTRSIVPRLREEVESVVRHAVYEAVAEELAGHAGTPPFDLCCRCVGSVTGYSPVVSAACHRVP